MPDAFPLYEAYPEMPLVSISDWQRRPMPDCANWLTTIQHGLGPEVCPFDSEGGDYLAFLGRISPEKRPDRAIEIAKLVGLKLRIAAKVDNADLGYFKATIEPMLDHPLIEFVGEINEGEKREFLGKACALLFPIDWPEPFGLVMIESMSAGTPVIAWRNGSVPEVIFDGVNRRHRRFHRERSRRGADGLSDEQSRRSRGVRTALHRRANGARLRRRLSRAAGAQSSQIAILAAAFGKQDSARRAGF
jgi:glycosyltransferase involved in cell wall biosynthesis